MPSRGIDETLAEAARIQLDVMQGLDSPERASHVSALRAKPHVHQTYAQGYQSPKF